MTYITTRVSSPCKVSRSVLARIALIERFALEVVLIGADIRLVRLICEEIQMLRISRERGRNIRGYITTDTSWSIAQFGASDWGIRRDQARTGRRDVAHSTRIRSGLDTTASTTFDNGNTVSTSGHWTSAVMLCPNTVASLRVLISIHMWRVQRVLRSLPPVPVR